MATMLRLRMETTARVAVGDPENPSGPAGLHDADTGLPINDATVQLLSITDEITGALVSGVSFPITLSYLSGSAGVYKGKVPAAAAFQEGRFYEVKVRATTVAGDQTTLYASVPAVR